MPLTDLSFLQPAQQWPPPTEQERLQLYADNRALFEGKHELVFKDSWQRLLRPEEKLVLEIVLNWPRRLSTLWADLLLGEPPLITAGEQGSAEQDAVERIIRDNDLHNVAYEVALDVSRFGTGLFKVRYDGRGIIEAIPPSIWFSVVNRDNIKAVLAHVLAWMYEAPDSSRKAKRLRVEIHERGRITYRTYALAEQGQIGEQVENERVEQFNLDEFLVVPVHNLMTSDVVVGKDDYSDLDSVVSELEVRVAQVSRILDKHADPSMYGDDAALEQDPKTGLWHVRGGSKFFPVQPNGVKPGYLVWDGQLEAAFKQIELLMQQFYALSETSPAAFGELKQGLAESGSALRRLMMAPLSKVNRIRMRFDPALKKVLRLASQLEAAQGMTGAVALEDVAIAWQDGLPTDEAELTDLTVRRVDAGLISKESALRRLDGLDGEALQEELERIAEDEAANAAPTPVATRFGFAGGGVG